MLARQLAALAAALALTPAATALPAPYCNSTAQSKRVLKATYKQTSICETTPGVKGYSGYVNLPPSELTPYEQNLFFLFFEARKDPANAPLTLWLQGGPGAPSVDQAVSMNGPCIVLPDSQNTELNPWSWNSEVNMLWIDQPIQTGYSYDTVNRGKVGLINGTIVLDGQPEDPNEFYIPWEGNFSSQVAANVPNTTHNAAVSVYEFMQAWMSTFPEYQRDSIGLWAQSYGGHWAPGIATYFLEQNAAAGCGNVKIGIDNVGIISGYIDPLIQTPFYPEYAINNTYGTKMYSDEVAAAVVDVWEQPGGCRDSLTQCQAAIKANDPGLVGNAAAEIAAPCGAAYNSCFVNIFEVFYVYSGRNPFDIGQATWQQFPPPYSAGYLNSDAVRQDLGAAINYTETGVNDLLTYLTTGDFMRGSMDEIGQLLDANVPVTLINGDRDYKCNWFGGEAISLAINHTGSAAFTAAGYADLVVNASYVGGKTRQAGLLSFTRLFEAGHDAPFYQPEAVYQLFSRATQHLDAATGQHPIVPGGGFATQGPQSVLDVRSAMPPPQDGFCYLMGQPALAGSCTPDQVAALKNGTAVVKDLVVVSPAWVAPGPLPTF